MASDEQLWDALSALRSGARAANDAHAWRSVSDFLDLRGGGSMHDEARQMTLLKLMRAYSTMEADNPRSCSAWVRRVYDNAKLDLLRQRQRRLARSSSDRELDQIPAPSSVSNRPDEEILKRFLARAKEICLEFISSRHKSPKRISSAHRLLDIAIRRIVLAQTPDEVIEALRLIPPPSLSTIYKWTERGRDRILIPAMDQWSLAPGEDPQAVAFAIALRDLALASRRRDHGRARKAPTP